MKSYIIKSIYLHAIVLFAVSCSETGILKESTKTVVLNIVTSEFQTRTAFGPKTDNLYPGYWVDGESAKICMSYTSGSQVIDGNIKAQTQKNAMIHAVMNAVDGSNFVYYAVVPASNYIAFDPADGLQFNIPILQKPTASSYDPAASAIIGKSDIYDTQQGSGDLESKTGNIAMNFDFAVAYGKVSISNMTLADGESIKSVALISTDVDIAGTANYKDGQISVVEGKKEITIATSTLKDIWFTALPSTLLDGKWKVIVSTTSGKYERTISGLNKSLNLTKGIVTEFTVDMLGVVCQPSTHSKTVQAANCILHGDALALDGEYITGLRNDRSDFIEVTFTDVPQAGIYSLKFGMKIWQASYWDPNGWYTFYYTVNLEPTADSQKTEGADKILGRFDTLFELSKSVTLQAGSNTIRIYGDYVHPDWNGGFTPHFHHFTIAE